MGGSIGNLPNLQNINYMYIGWVNKNNIVTFVTDGNGCYDEQGKCICAECYYLGADHVNCGYVSHENGKPVTWNKVTGKWEIIVE